MKMTRFLGLAAAVLLCTAALVAFNDALAMAQHVWAQLQAHGDVSLAMTTLAAQAARSYEQGDMDHVPVIAADIIYEGAAVGVVAASGHARPLVAGDRFVGFASREADNSLGAAADINVEVRTRGQIQLSVTGAVITDRGMAVYASDDNAFSFSPVGGTFIGFMKRFVSAGVAVVEFDSVGFRDPYAAWSVRETLSANKTLDAEDSGKLFWVDTDAFTITLPAIATGLGGFVVVNGGAFGAVAVTISPAAADMILGPDITGADDKDLINTKATARRGDLVQLDLGDADGYVVTQLRGTWARQA